VEGDRTKGSIWAGGRKKGAYKLEGRADQQGRRFAKNFFHIPKRREACKEGNKEGRFARRNDRRQETQ